MDWLKLGLLALGCTLLVVCLDMLWGFFTVNED